MGRLDQPANTFWQLLFKPTGGGKWSNQVEATATATNGGLVLASAGGHSLIVGVRPSADLTFTPLISTSDAARTWSNGLVDQALEARPDALAADGTGQALALVGAPRSAQVLSANGEHLSVWHELVSRRALAATGGGRSCQLGALTSVGYLAGRAVIGASCAHPGVVGIFAENGKGWRLVGPGLQPPLRQGRVEVLSLGGTRDGAYGLIAVVNGNKTDLVATWSGRGGRWATSRPLPLGPGEQVSSSAPTEDGLFALLRTSAGKDHLMTVSRPGTVWHSLAAPPRGTATVAFGATSGPDALVANGNKLTILSLSPGSSKWRTVQELRVAIQYGSSS